MTSTHHDISLLFENIVLILMKQTGINQERLIRTLLRSDIYSRLISGELDISVLTPEGAVGLFMEEGLIDET